MDWWLNFISKRFYVANFIFLNLPTVSVRKEPDTHDSGNHLEMNLHSGVINEISLLCHQSTYLEKFPEPVCDRERIQEKGVIVPTQPSPLVEFPVLHFSRKKRPRQDRYKYDVAQEDLNFCNQVLSQ